MRNIHGVLDGNKSIMLHSPLDIVVGPLIRGGSNVKLGAMAITYAIGFQKLYMAMVGTKAENMLQSLNMVHLHFTLSSRAHQ